MPIQKDYIQRVGRLLVKIRRMQEMKNSRKVWVKGIIALIEKEVTEYVKKQHQEDRRIKQNEAGRRSQQRTMLCEDLSSFVVHTHTHTCMLKNLRK